MPRQVREKRIVEQYSQFVESQKTSRQAGTQFLDELQKKMETAEESKRSAKGSSKVLPTENDVSGAKGPIAKPRAITKEQATRLARYAPLIEASAKKHNVPVELICGVILQESGAQHRAVSHCGARGLMQLMPGTARRFGVTNSFNPAQNIDGGTRYLAWLLNNFKGNVPLAVAAYNSGEGNVEKYGNRIPPFRETQNYVPAVLGYTQSMIDIFVATKAEPVPISSRRV